MSGTGMSGTLTGVYPSTEKLKNAGITGKVMNKMMEAALEKGLSYEKETLPEWLMKQYGLVTSLCKPIGCLCANYKVVLPSCGLV